ncbi:MAG: hypothetical protein F6J87_09725 [Spirulina sp. SIO3F2]|nr:hypothetical protein [Spirulina sp. SIO3F2]
MQMTLAENHTADWLIYPALNLLLYDGRDRDPIREDWGDKQVRRLPAPYNGYRYQRILGDFYALQINGMDSSDDAHWTYHPKSLNCLLEIKETLVAEKDTIGAGSLGETWVAVGRLAEPDQDVQMVAEHCYQAIGVSEQLSWQEDLVGHGRILDATCYELWSPPSVDAKPVYHLYICIFDYGAGLKRLDRLYHHLLTLGLYRHQATWAYQQSRAIQSTLLDDYHTIRTLHQAARFNLEQEKPEFAALTQTLGQGLLMLSRYTESLNRLVRNIHLLESALEQYRDRYRLLAKLDANAQIQFLERFRNFAIRRYIRPLKQDYVQLNPGLQLLEDSIQIMQGMLQIEQFSQQFHLERTAIAATVGLGSATLTGIAIIPQIVQPQVEPKSMWSQGFDVVLILVISLLCGVGCGSLAWRWLPKILKS